LYRRLLDRWKLEKGVGDLRIGVIGGGITGLTCAYYLSKAGVQTTVIESLPTTGGLVRTFDFGPFQWDKYYHAILTSDTALLELIEDLGLNSELRWKETKTGFCSKHGLHSMSNSIEFLKFPVLSLWEKFRLGLGILYAARLKNVGELEETLVSDWLIRIFGRGVYDKVWGPLLKSKLGACRDEASAAFIWSYITRYYSTRQKGSSKKEILGYPHGSYSTVLSRLVEKLEEMGANFLLNSPVEKIESVNGIVKVHAHGQVHEFDKVIFTGPSHVLPKLAPQLSRSYVDQLMSVKYLGVVCTVLLLKRPLSSFYVTNLIDPDLPMTGIIEMTAMVDTKETAGRHLVYVPRYTVPNDPYFNRTDDEVWNDMRAGLTKAHPDLRDEDIERRFIFREKYVQPIPVLRYSKIVPRMETGIPGLYLANTTFIINKTLSNNENVKIAGRVVRQILGLPESQTLQGDTAVFADRVPVLA
jgi:protoporphyrinogen oxidase